MAKREDRRGELAEAACDWALEHGVLGLSLRPLAAALGTSDRMLVYYFGTRDALVADIIERSTARSVAVLAGLPAQPDVASGVRALWAAYKDDDGQLDRCQWIYAQAAAQDMLGAPEGGAPAAPVARANDAWIAALAGYLTRCGAAESAAARCARFVDAAVMGLHLDRHVERDEDLSVVVNDLASAALLLSGVSFSRV
ncbi:TetR family transcriptional regulator [Spongisporangium articulatum]|uniref:TetR family transcriptional regulator n=1 Tax=Spongisporangium articulatum TaxID=3362603 RepID=A0ABW8ARP1_9ACTN